MPDQKITRRHALTGAATVGIGLPLLAACGGSTTASDPGAATPQSSGTSAGSTGADVLTRTTDVPVKGGKILADANVVVTQPAAGTFKGFVATCTHQGCQVSSVSGGTINCACHGSEFSITDGSVVNGPATLPLTSVDLTVQGADILSNAQ